jgi:3'-5' exoribonuclease
MKSIYVTDITKGMTLNGETFAVQEVTLAETKDGKPYYRINLIDKTGSISGQIWSDNIINVDKKALNTGNVISISATVEEYKGNLQLNILGASRVDESSLAEYMEASDFDLEELWQILKTHIDNIANIEIKSFLHKIFADENFRLKFRAHPAAEYVHHSFQGGLLEHVTEMLEMMIPLKKFYKEANFDLVTAGIILHDIGKLDELTINGTVVQRTKEGYLVGHLVKSYEFLLTHGKDSLSEEIMVNLKHIILSHHGLLEFGSPVLPATIEAAVVHALDEASSKVRIFQKILRKNINNKEDFAQWDNILKTRVYKAQINPVDLPDQFSF